MCAASPQRWPYPYWPSPSRPAEARTAPSPNGAVPEVSGATDKKPKVAKGKGDPPKDLKVKVLKKGRRPEGQER